MRRPYIICAMLLLLAGASASPLLAADFQLSALKTGGYVLVFRHGATDESQKDVYPFNFDDMKAQRQLSDKGRDTARQISAAMKKLAIPVGEIYTSRLNRAFETGKLLTNRDVKAIDGLTDSSTGSASGMANPTGGNTKAGHALHELVDTAPKAGTDTLLVTHKTNITDAFGKDFSDVQEGEALVYKSNGSGPSTFVARIKPADWIAAN